MSSSVSAVSSPKEASRVWCGWGSRTITSLPFTCGEGTWMLWTFYIIVRQRLEGKMTSLFLYACIVCMYAYLCVCIFHQLAHHCPTHYSMAWHGMAWHGMVWYDMIWYICSVQMLNLTRYATGCRLRNWTTGCVTGCRLRNWTTGCVTGCPVAPLAIHCCPVRQRDARRAA